MYEQIINSRTGQPFECDNDNPICPYCNAIMRYDCDINIETGSLDIYIICYSCGHTETK